MTILWESPSDARAVVRYGQGGLLDRRLTVAPPAPLQGLTPWTFSGFGLGRTNSLTVQITNVCYVYVATLEGLRPDTVYHYEVEMLGKRSLRARFRTFGTRSDRVRFIAYGDSRSRPEIHAQLARRFLRHDPAFILHTGDLVGRGRNYGLWSREFFEPLRGIIDRVPLLPALGNHEEDGTNYFAYFHLPKPERWYSFDVGPVHVLGLDYHFEKATDPQFQFAQRDLMSSRAAWKVVFLHYPMFNVGGHASTWGHDVYLPLFHEAGVDLVLSGHSHVYERFRPLVPEGRAGSAGIVHLTTGGGGAPLYPVYPHPALSAKASVNHFVLLEATRDHLSGRAFTSQGTTLDRFKLRKDQATALLVAGERSYSEEKLKLWFEVSRHLVARLSAVPNRSSPTRAAIELQPSETVTGPVDLELSLASESSTNYTLLNGAIRCTLPRAGEARKLVWMDIVSRTGRLANTNSSGELSPALVFQARFLGDAGDLVARGGRSKLGALPTQQN